MTTVYGHALKYIRNGSNEKDYGSYGILSRSDSDEVLEAFFRVSEVIGVFSGELSKSGESEPEVVGASTEAELDRLEAQRRRALEDPNQGI